MVEGLIVKGSNEVEIVLPLIPEVVLQNIAHLGGVVGFIVRGSNEVEIVKN